MKKSLTLIILCFSFLALKAQTYYSRHAGSWSDVTSVWSTISQTGAACSCDPGTSLSGSKAVYIYNGITANTLQSLTGSSVMIVEAGDSLTINDPNTFNISGSSSIVVNSGGKLIFNCNISMAGSSSISNNGIVIINSTLACSGSSKITTSNTGTTYLYGNVTASGSSAIITAGTGYVYGNLTSSGSSSISTNGTLFVYGNVSTSGSSGYIGTGNVYVIGGTVTGSNTSMIKTGNNCSNAISLVNGINTTYVSFQPGDSALWVSFIAIGNYANIFIGNPTSSAAINTYKVILYQGPCNTLDSLTSSSLTLRDSSLIVLNSTVLTSGATYYVKLISNPRNIHKALNTVLNIAQSTITNNCVAPTDPCELVSNGEFEVMNVTQDGPYGNIRPYSTLSDVACWYTLFDNHPGGGSGCALLEFGLPDYFNSINAGSCIYSNSNLFLDCVPTNYEGTASDRIPGNHGYAGINVAFCPLTDYCFGIPNLGGLIGPVGYITQPLTKTLTTGAIYKISFWVQLANDKTGGSNGLDGLELINPTLGLYFSSDLLTWCPYGFFDGSSPAETPTDPSTSKIPVVGNVICPANGASCSPAWNTPNTWVNITETYVATGTEKWITLGNFEPTYDPSEVSNPSGNPNAVEAYYYIDGVSITQISSTPFSIIASPSGIICPGTPTTLSVNPATLSDTYQWSTGATGTSITVSPTNCLDTYVATAYASDGCSGATASYSPTNILDPEITGPSLVCDGSIITKPCLDEGNVSYYQLQFNVTDPCNACSPTYTWSINPASAPYCNGMQLVTSTGTTGVVDVPTYDGFDIQNGFTITVTATCGNVSCSQSFSVNGCCGTPSPTTLDDLTLSSLGNVSPIPSDGTYTDTYNSGVWTFTNFYNTPLYINGTLTVNQSLTISNSDVILGPDAEIYVAGGNSLTLVNCHLHACSQMWKGIQMSSPIFFSDTHTSSLTITNSLIEDAKTAVLSSDGFPLATGTANPITITGSDFNKDYIGLDIQNYDFNTVSNQYPLTLSTTTFSCNNSNWSGFPNFIWSITNSTTLDPNGPYAGLMSDIGILINNVNYITIGTPGTTPTNTFENLYEGIHTIASNTTVYNNTFENIDYPPLPFYNYGLSGAGIKALGDATGAFTLNVGGTLATELNTFQDNCRNGVFARDTINVNIYNNVFNNVGTGINLEKTYKTKLNVGFTSSTFNTFNNTVVGVYTYDNPWANIQINWNQMTNTTIGVHVVETGYNHHNSCTVSENTIGTNSLGVDGVFFKGTIKSNTINLPQLCIPHPPFLCPLIPIDGIYLAPTQLSSVYNNTVNGYPSPTTGNGIVLQAPNTSNNSVTCNNINNGINSVEFLGNQIVGTYFDINNMTDYTNIGVYFNSTGDIGPQGNASNGTGNNWTSANNCGTGVPWATYNSKGASQTTSFYVSSAFSGCNYFPTSNGPLTFPITFTPSLGVDCFVCSGTGPCIANNNGNNMNASIAKEIISGGSSSLGSTGLVPPYFASTLWDERHSLFLSLHSIDSSLLDSSSIIKNFYDSAMHSNMGYLQNVETALFDSNGVSDSDINVATQNIAAIVNPNSSESTLQSVYNIIIQMISNHQSYADSAQMANLQTIAPLCPFQFGYGVYIARALLNPIDSNVYSNVCETDTATTHDHEAMRKKKKTLTANVYPNPANTVLNIQIIPLPDDSIASENRVEYIYLYDELGNLVQKAELTNDFVSMPLTRLAAGLYYYRIVDDQMNPIRTDNLLIIK